MNSTYNVNLRRLIDWANIDPGDQKMMFCARQTARWIKPELMAELTLAANTMRRLSPESNPAEYARLERRFLYMVLYSIRDTSARADNGVRHGDGMTST